MYNEEIRKAIYETQGYKDRIEKVKADLWEVKKAYRDAI